MKIGAIIQTRMGSTRFPGKVLENLKGDRKILDYVVNQVKFCQSFNNLIIATTTLEQDDVIVEYAKNNNLEFFRGEPLDVLDRYYQCAKHFELETVIRMTSDCPFLDPEIVDKTVNLFQKNEYDYVSNNMIRTFPVGFDVEVFSFHALEKAWNEAILPSEREHVTPYIKKNSNIFKIFNLENEKRTANYRITIDRREDLVFLKEIAKNINHDPIKMKDINELLGKKPKIRQLYNNKMNISEGYDKSLKDDARFLENLKNEKK